MSITDYTTFDPTKGELLSFPDGTLRWVGKLHNNYWLIDGVTKTDADVKSMLFQMLDWAAPCIDPTNPKNKL